MSEFTNKNIWVFIETDEGKAKSVGLELLNPGRMLAEKSGEKLVAVVLVLPIMAVILPQDCPVVCAQA